MRTLLLVLMLAAPALALPGGVAPRGALPEVPPGALGSGAVDDGEPTVHARLLVDARTAASGETLRLGVLFEMERGWHIYWRNPGDTGFPTRLSWDVPGAEIGPTRWPAPQVFREEETLTTYGYAGRALLFNEAHVAAAPGATLHVSVDADFLVCRVQCIPGRISLARSLPVGSERHEDAGVHGLFDLAQRFVPRPAEEYGLTVDVLYSQSAIRPGDSFLAGISLVCEPDAPRCPKGLASRTGGSFVPERLPSLGLRPTGSRAHPFSDGRIFTLEGRATTEDVPLDRSLRGVVEVEGLGDDASLAVIVELPLPRAPVGAAIEARPSPWLLPEPPPYAGVSGWRAIALALLGGLILNLMPCVLPVLAIKVFGIAERAHADRREVVLHGVVYTLGILVTMSALAAVVVGLRAAGTAVGWGFQFQEPAFVAAISSLLLVFALNLFGVFEVGLPASLQPSLGERTTGLPRSFFEGLLAVLLATPCSAPFLGTAVGFAFASSAPVILGIFLAIGLGLASPFVAVSLVPGLARWLPSSGPWMLQLRAMLGFALLATILWLLWITGRSLGTDGMSTLLAFLLLLGLGVWTYGVRQRATGSGRAPWVGGTLAAASVAGLLWLPLEAAESAEPAAVSEREDGLAAARFEPGAVAAQLAAGRPVFVYFTADWCLTCKVNERVVLRDERVAQALARQDVASFEADWTLRDETIRAELARFGRAGVPMYLVYDPRDPDRPELLPELLTVDRVLAALARLGA